MKKQLNFPGIVSYSRVKRLKTILVLLLLTLFFSVHAQIVSLTGYPDGTVIKNCPGANCEIILPPISGDEEYIFTIPLTGGDYTTASVDFDTTWTNSDCSTLKNNTIYDMDKELGIISIIPGELCSQYDTLSIKVKAVYNGTETEYLIYKFPVKYRLPVKTVMVLDISGSMNRIEENGNSRWEILKKSVEVFTGLHEWFRQEDDEIGLSYFTSYVIQPNPPISDGFLEITTWDAEPSTKDTINKDMNGRHPLYATAMGKGLFDAKTKLKADVTNRYRKIAVLFTDGLQNVYPFVNNLDGNTLSDGKTLNNYSEDNVDSIRYFTIATWGAASGTTPQVLANIADNSNAHALITISTAEPSSMTNDVYNYFWVTLENILKGGSPQIIGSEFGQLSSNEITHTFQLNSNISKVMFVLTHEENDDITITIKKNGVIITDQASLGSSSFYKMMGLEFPTSGDTPVNSEGEYEIKVSGTTQNFYELTCIADDHYFNYECNIDNAIYKTGDTIRFSANLNYAGTPFTDADDTVKIILLKPGDDINHLLAIYETPDIEYDEDNGTPAQQKFEYLYKNNPDFYDALLPQDQVIYLSNQGNGYYTSEYTDTYLTGIYEIIFLIDGKDATRGTFKRKTLHSAVFKYGLSNPVDIEVVDDNIAPSAPSNLTSSNITQSTVDLNWHTSTDISGITNYHIYQDGVFLLSTADPDCSITGLNTATTYEFYVNAEDGFTNISDPSNTINVITLDEVDILKPTIPANLTALNIAQTSFYLSWEPSTDDIGVTEYVIYQDGELLVSTSNINYSITGLNPGTNYSLHVTAKDFANNESEASEELNITTLDIPEVISAPTKLTPYNITETTLNLTWEASNSNVGILEYYIYQDGSLIVSAPFTNYYVSNLKPSTKYNFHVIARDTEGNLSEASNPVNIATLNKTEGNYGILGIKIRPQNKFGYYLGPGFKSIIKCKYLPKGPQKPIVFEASILYASDGDEQMGDPYLKNIVDNLDGSYYLVLANVAPKTNPRIEISIGGEVVHSDPIYKIPIWFYILLIIVIIFILILLLKKQQKLKIFKILWSLLIVLIVIWILHYTGQLFFLYLL